MELIRAVSLLLKSLLVLLVLCSDGEARDSDLSYVTCGSLVKLLNTRHNVRLHSHDVKYGSGNLQLSLNIPEPDLGSQVAFLRFFKYYPGCRCGSMKP